MFGSPRGLNHAAGAALLLLVMLGVTPAGGCTDGGATTSDVGNETPVGLAYPLDSANEVLTTALPGAAISMDPTESSDGTGSLRISAEEPVTVPLVETGDLDIEDSTLFYRAKLRAENLQGDAYLEMWCTFPDLGEYFSRGLDQPVSGSTNWVSAQTPFMLEAGQNPDNVKLNVVIDGVGTVWVDQLELYGVATR